MIEKYKKDLVKYIARIIKKVLVRGNKVFVAGNGGSLATAVHFSEDLLLNNDLKSRVILLNNASVLTAVSNDFGYESVFVKQLENLFDQGDLLVTISASGMSQNLIDAIEYANINGNSVSISGFHGGQTKKIATRTIFVRTKVGSYEETEDLHLIICHMIVKYINEVSK
jgi:D-sedoheptulose 7-phosphate isomerase